MRRHQQQLMLLPRAAQINERNRYATVVPKQRSTILTGANRLAALWQQSPTDIK